MKCESVGVIVSTKTIKYIFQICITRVNIYLFQIDLAIQIYNLIKKNKTVNNVHTKKYLNTVKTLKITYKLDIVC